MTAEESLKSFGLLDADGEVHSYAEELSLAFNLYAQDVAGQYNKISDQFLSYLDEEMKKCEYGRLHYDFASHNVALVQLQVVKEKYLSLINNYKS